MFDEKKFLFQKGDLVKAIPYFWEYHDGKLNHDLDTLVINRQDLPYEDIGVVTEVHPIYGGQNNYSVYWQKLQKYDLMSERCLKKITR